MQKELVFCIERLKITKLLELKFPYNKNLSIHSNLCLKNTLNFLLKQINNFALANFQGTIEQTNFFITFSLKKTQ